MFETWIFGSPVELITDQNPLTFITKNAPQSSKLQRLALSFQEYEIRVSHCPGVQLQKADRRCLDWELQSKEKKT